MRFGIVVRLLRSIIARKLELPKRAGAMRMASSLEIGQDRGQLAPDRFARELHEAASEGSTRLVVKARVFKLNPS
jgi:hypothetical protein